MPKRAVSYARVSGDDRHTEGRNLQAQLEMCRQYAAEHGYEVVAELAEDDRGASGAAFELPQLNAIREMARAGGFDVLVVREMDRLSRKLAKQLFVEEELKRAKINIEYVKGEYDDTPEGNLMKNVRAVVAEYERLKIIERTVSARYLAVAQGSALAHGSPPFGYRQVREGARFDLVIDEEEAAVVRLVFDLYLHGENGGRPMNSYQIAEALTARGVLSAVDRGKSRVPKKRASGEWAPASVSGMLRDESYAGTWHYRKHVTEIGADGKRHRYTRPKSEWLAVEVPAIISRETWEMACARRQVNREAARRRLKEPQRYLLRGRVVCGACGAKMQGIAPSPGKPHTYYKCPATAHKANYAHRCKAKHFRVDQVDTAVWLWVRDLLEHPRALASGLLELRKRQQSATRPLDGELENLESSLVEARRRGERLLDAYLSGDVAKEVFTQRNRPLQETISRLEQRQGELLKERDDVVMSEEDLETIVAFTEAMHIRMAEQGEDPEFQRFAVEKLNVRAVLFEEDGEKKANVRCAFGEGGVLRLNELIGVVAVHRRITGVDVAAWVVT